jgi:hypothetical protein
LYSATILVIMKKIIPSTIGTILIPIRLIKKISRNSFINGLIIGAVFSLIVNIITVQVQEELQKQRILEAVENEIMTNMLQAGNVIKFNNNALATKQKINYLYTSMPYSRDLWEQSSEPLRYIAQLDQDLQIKLIGYYTYSTRFNNTLVDKTNSLLKEHSACFFSVEPLSKKDQELCDVWNEAILQTELMAATAIEENSFELLKSFHPTKDRLNNPFLRIMLGDKSMRILSGK